MIIPYLNGVPQTNKGKIMPLPVNFNKFPLPDL